MIDEMNRRYRKLAEDFGYRDGCGPGGGWSAHKHIMKILRCEIPDPFTKSFLTHVDLLASGLWDDMK